MALATISLQVAQLTATICGVHSCIMGAWVSMMIYRRPLAAIFSHAFKLVSNEEAPSKNHIAAHLPRQDAQELALAAVLASFMMSNLGGQCDRFRFV